MVAGELVRRTAPVPTPLRRGAAAAVVTGGALAVAAVAATVPLPVDPAVVTAAAVLPFPDPAGQLSPVGAGDDAAPGRLPVPADVTARLDTASLVKAVQLAERRLRSRGGAVLVPPDDGDAAPPAAGTKATEDADAEPDVADDEDAPAPTATAGCDLDTSDLGRVRPHVRAAAEFLGCRFGEPTMFGVAGRGGASDHPSGRAVDFMVDRVTGNALAACALRDQEELGVKYVIWRQRINFGEGWEPMADRGGVTANHFDHVHVSFNSAAGGSPSGC
jgi:hypothetical protein